MKRNKKRDVEIYRRGNFSTHYNLKTGLYEVKNRGTFMAEFDTDSAATAYCKSLWISECKLDDGR